MNFEPMVGVYNNTGINYNLYCEVEHIHELLEMIFLLMIIIQ